MKNISTLFSIYIMFCHVNLFISYALNIIIHQIPKILWIEHFKKCEFNLMGRLQHLVSLLHPPALKKRNNRVFYSI